MLTVTHQYLVSSTQIHKHNVYFVAGIIISVPICDFITNCFCCIRPEVLLKDILKMLIHKQVIISRKRYKLCKWMVTSRKSYMAYLTEPMQMILTDLQGPFQRFGAFIIYKIIYTALINYLLNKNRVFRTLMPVKFIDQNSLIRGHNKKKRQFNGKNIQTCTYTHL